MSKSRAKRLISLWEEEGVDFSDETYKQQPKDIANILYNLCKSKDEAKSKIDAYASANKAKLEKSDLDRLEMAKQILDDLYTHG